MKTRTRCQDNATGNTVKVLHEIIPKTERILEGFRAGMGFFTGPMAFVDSRAPSAAAKGILGEHGNGNQPPWVSQIFPIWNRYPWERPQLIPRNRGHAPGEQLRDGWDQYQAHAPGVHPARRFPA